VSSQQNGGTSSSHQRGEIPTRSNNHFLANSLGRVGSLLWCPVELSSGSLLRLADSLSSAANVRYLADQDITKAEVQRFLASKRKQGFSGSSVHGMRTALGKVLQAAVDWNYLEQNSARGIRLGDRAPSKERAYLLPEQLSPLLNSLPELCRRLVVITVFDRAPNR